VSLVKYNNNSISAVTSTALGAGGLVPIKTLTASSSSTLSFVHGSSDVILDSTYPIYIFKFIDIHPSVDAGNLEFNMSVDSGSNYNVTKTTTAFYGYQTENGASTGLGYDTNLDLAQGTGFQKLLENVGTDNDQCGVGTLIIFNPSSDTFIKHFMFTGIRNGAYEYAVNYYFAGYGNTTSAVNAIRFRMHSGDIDSGKIKLYGIKDS